MTYSKPCKNCNKFFQPKTKSNLVCPECYFKNHYRKPKTLLVCKICNKTFHPDSGNLKQLTCSKKCGYALRTQKKREKKEIKMLLEKEGKNKL